MLGQVLLAVALVGDTAPFFGPEDNCRAELIQHINEARHTILVRADSFTDPDIAKALVAKSRPALGLTEPQCHVTVIIDRPAASQKGSQAEYCEKEGLAIRVDSKHKYAHRIAIVIDYSSLHPDDPHAKVLTGSIAVSRGGQPADIDNLLVIWNDLSTIRAYYNNWQMHCDHSEVYVPKQKAGPHKPLRTADGKIIKGADGKPVPDDFPFKDFLAPRGLEIKPVNPARKK